MKLKVRPVEVFIFTHVVRSKLIFIGKDNISFFEYALYDVALLGPSFSIMTSLGHAVHIKLINCDRTLLFSSLWEYNYNVNMLYINCLRVIFVWSDVLIYRCMYTYITITNAKDNTECLVEKSELHLNCIVPKL